MDFAEPSAAGIVERRGANLFEQLLDHRADPHDLGRLFDHVGERGRGVHLAHGLLDRRPVGTDGHDAQTLRPVRLLSHNSIVPNAEMHMRAGPAARHAGAMTVRPAPTGVAAAVRMLTAADVDAVVDLATVCELAETGETDPELIEWIVSGIGTADVHAFGIDDEHRLAAFGFVECVAGHTGIEAEVRVRPGLDHKVGAPLLAAVRQAAADFDPAKPVHMFANSGATAHRRWLEAQGAMQVRHFWRMLIDFGDTPPAVPTLPDGTSVRGARDDEADLRAIFEVVDTSFAEHFGHTEERTYERWLETWHSRRGFDLSLWWVIEVDAAPVAALLGLTFTDDEGVTTGHVATLGTMKEHRGRGIGSYLLRTAFREFHGRGMRKVTLGVDSENITGAVRLYESVGMRAVVDWPLYELPPVRGRPGP
jgi:mycothiol synthase